MGSVVDIGVGKLVAATIDGGSAKDYQLFANGVVLVDILGTLKPHEVDHAMTIAEMAHDALFAGTHGIFVVAQHASADLDKGHVAADFADAIDAAAVYIFIRKVLKQVTPGLDAKLFAQNLFLLGPNARKIHHVLVENVQHSVSAIFKSKGVVILMFSRLPSTISTLQPMASTTEASSVNSSRKS